MYVDTVLCVTLNPQEVVWWDTDFLMLRPNRRKNNKFGKAVLAVEVAPVTDFALWRMRGKMTDKMPLVPFFLGGFRKAIKNVMSGFGRGFDDLNDPFLTVNHQGHANNDTFVCIR